MAGKTTKKVEGGMITIETRDIDGIPDAARTVTFTPDAGTPNDNADQTRDRAEKAFNGLQAVTNSTGPLTVAQLSNAVRLLATVLLHILRLQLGRHEDVD
jgi:hypothetical protein